MLTVGGPAKVPPRGSGPAQPADQAGGIPTAAAHPRYLVVEAGDHLGDGELGANLPCRLGADTQVLSHPVNREAEVELVVDHGLAAILHLPGLRRALRDHVEHEFRVEAGLDGEVETFGQAL